MSGRAHTIEALVLKTKKSGEVDKLLCVFTPERGKLWCVAKGARRLSSSKRSLLEPGNHLKVQLLTTSGMAILTQAVLLSDSHLAFESLAKQKQLFWLLEMVDKLFVGEEETKLNFSRVMKLRNYILAGSGNRVQLNKLLDQVVAELGHPQLAETHYHSFTEYVEYLSDSSVKSWAYLTVK